MMWDDGRGGWQMVNGGPGWATVVLLLVLVLVVAIPLVALLTERMLRRRDPGDRSGPLLRERLARGEITEAEYLSLRDALQDR